MKLNVVTVILSLFLTTIHAQACPQLILNSLNEHSFPRNFRTSDSHPHLNGLNASASGQFSEKGFNLIIGNIAPAKITIVDLREESHWFVNGHAVSWRDERNWINRGKTLQAIEHDEKLRQHELISKGVHFIPSKERIHQIQPHYVMDEKTLVEQMGFRYIRFPVTDHCVPRNEEIEQFVQFYNQLEEDEWVHYHCCAGKGRSSLFMVMHDIMRNGDRVPLNEILKRQAELGGKNYTLLVPKESWKAHYHQERMDFIHRFYQFRLETGGSSISWSAWSIPN